MIYVQTLTGKSFNVKTTQRTTVLDVKEALSDAYFAEFGTELPPEHQRLVAPGGVILENTKTLSEYGIRDHTIITLLIWRLGRA